MILNVATFNMLNSDDNSQWYARRDIIIPILKSHNVDICGSQELTKKQAEQLAKTSSAYKYIQEEIRQDEKSSDGSVVHFLSNAIWYKADRFELQHYGMFWFGPDSNPQIRKTGGWGSGQNRYCNWAEFFDKQSGKFFFVFNVQWNDVCAAERLASAEILADKIDDIADGRISIVLGDFNAAIGEKSLSEFMCESDMLEARSVSMTIPFGQRGTYHDFTGIAKGEPIDHIFVPEDSRVLRCGTLTDNKNGVYPSDHFPFFAEIAFYAEE